MTVNKEQLQSFLNRIDNLETEVSNIREDIKSVYDEAKASGLDTKAIKKIIAILKKDRDDLNEEEFIINEYRKALNI